MNIDSIRSYCLEFPGATEKLQWGDNLCFKVRGKIFAILGLDEQQLCFKCDPEIFAELLERQSLAPAPYLGRYKWILVEQLDALRDDEFQTLIGQSYEMVNANVKRRTRPRSSPRLTKEKNPGAAPRRSARKTKNSGQRARNKKP
jgi:predicted DNA-binding protein (MmcQ/YjbR family)